MRVIILYKYIENIHIKQIIYIIIDYHIVKL